MSIINLNVGNCQHCYKCIRLCPLKSIAFKDGSVSIIKQECVLCGTCVECCPQNARFTRNDIPKVQQLIAAGRRVYVTVAPSWEAYFEGVSFEELSASLKRLGFAGVEETAIGAAETSRSYAQLLSQGRMENIITTACPSAVMLVEQRYPHLIPMLAPVLSPMEAHASLMRRMYGDIDVVFAGPCLAKMHEAGDPLAGQAVNHAVTFSALAQWMVLSPQTADGPDAEAPGVDEPVARLYPKPAGILRTIPESGLNGYRTLAVDGVEECIALFDWLSLYPQKGLFIEANICRGGCLGGPVMRMDSKTPFGSGLLIDHLPKERDSRPAPTAQQRVAYHRPFSNRKQEYIHPTEQQVEDILAKIGKTHPESELNCGSCGYPTCRAKAEAVFLGKADINMCLPFLREQAENISSTVIEHSPNSIIALSGDMDVIDLNPRAEQIYGVAKQRAVGQMLPDFFGEDSFEQAKGSGHPVSKVGLVTSGNVEIEQTVVYIRESDTYIVFSKDITAARQHQRQLEELRMNTVDVAQRVIDKQMRVAQEIASLLGETTAETKVALTNLKKTMNGENQ